MTALKHPKYITAGQLQRAQILWSQYASRTLCDTARDARLAFASGIAGRTISSFRELTAREAADVIDALQKSLGIASSRKMRSRARAHAAGTEGKRETRNSKLETVVGPQDLARIADLCAELGWTQETFDRWLQSPTSPLKRTGAVIRTLADANCVTWALKNILRQRRKKSQ